MRKFIWWLAVAAALGCQGNVISSNGYATRYLVQERTELNQTLTHIGQLYYRGELLMNDVDFVSISPKGNRAVFSKKQRLYYSKDGAIATVDLLRYSLPTDVVWEKYRAEILFADQNHYELKLF